MASSPSWTEKHNWLSPTERGQPSFLLDTLEENGRSNTISRPRQKCTWTTAPTTATSTTAPTTTTATTRTALAGLHSCASGADGLAHNGKKKPEKGIHTKMRQSQSGDDINEDAIKGFDRVPQHSSERKAEDLERAEQCRSPHPGRCKLFDPEPDTPRGQSTTTHRLLFYTLKKSMLYNTPLSLLHDLRPALLVSNVATEVL